MELQYFGSAADVAAVETQLAQGPHPSRPALLAALAWYLRERDTRRSLALADEAQAEAASATESPRIAARLGLVRAEAKRLFGDARAARTLADDALQRFDAIGDFVGSGDAQMALATLARLGGDPATAGPAYDAARLTFERAGDTLRQQIVDLTHALLDIYADVEAGYARWSPLLAGIAALQQPELDAIAEMALGGYFFERRYDISIEHYQRSFEASLQTGQVAAAITAGANLTAAFNGLHSYETALQWAERTLELARAAGWPQSIGTALNQMGFVLRRLGRDAAAADILHEAVATFAPFPDVRNRAIACMYLGDLLLHQKQDEEALRQLEEAEAVAQRLGHESLQFLAVTAKAQALSRLERSNDAVAAADSCQAYVERDGSEQNNLVPVLLRLRAELARRHDLALPAGSTAPSAPIHYLEQELAYAESSSGSPVPDDLLSLLSRDYEAVGDLARALDYERHAAAARQVTHDKKATDLATALQSRHETERAKAEAQHQKSLAQAEAARADAEAAANRAKSTFLANMSHELRSPLNALLGFTRLLQRNPQLDAQAQDDLAIVLRSAEHLYALINQVLELSKIEAGRMGVVDSDIDLYALLDELGDMFAVGVRQKGAAPRGRQRSGGAAVHPRRRRQVAPGADQPAGQCGEVHRARPHCAAGGDERRRRTTRRLRRWRRCPRHCANRSRWPSRSWTWRRSTARSRLCAGRTRRRPACCRAWRSRSTISACAGCFDLSWARRPCAPHQATSVHLRSLAAEATVASMNRTPRAPSSTSAYSRAAGAMRPPCPRARMSAAMPR